MTIWCENCGEKNMTAENVRYPGTNKDGTTKTNPWEERPWCNKCKPCSDWCETTGDCSGNAYNKGKGPKNIPIFNMLKSLA